MSACELTKLFIEDNNPDKILLCTSIFYYDNYVRIGAFGKISNVTKHKQLLFINNLKNNIKHLEDGFFPDNWKIRIYFDASLIKFKCDGVIIWRDFIKMYYNHPKVELVKFKCPKYINSSNNHINLFGTILRFHILFDEDAKYKIACIIDADNYLVKNWITEILKFESNNYDFHTFNSKFEFAEYRFDIYSIFFNNVYLRAGMISSKVKFDINIWNFILNNLDKFPKYNRIIDKLNSNKTLQRNQSYHNYTFGFDEIFLNYFIKRILYEKGIKIDIVYYKSFSNRFIDYLSSELKYHSLLSTDKYNIVMEILLLNGIIYNNDISMEDNITKHSEKQKKEKIMSIVLLYRENIELLKSLNMQNKVIYEFINNFNYKTEFKYNNFNYYFRN
jgi:hypothetical protein